MVVLIIKLTVEAFLLSIQICHGLKKKHRCFMNYKSLDPFPFTYARTRTAHQPLLLGTAKDTVQVHRLDNSPAI